MTPKRMALVACCSVLALSALVWIRLQGPFDLDEPVDRGRVTSLPLPANSQVLDHDHLARATLSAAETAAGFRIMPNPENGGDTIVHPNSPCWLELPGPAERAGVDISVEATGAGGSARDELPPSETGPDAKDAGQFVGPIACVPCHRQKYLDFVETAHYRSSSPASSTTIDGSFAEGDNKLLTNHPDLYFAMTEEEGGFYQEVHFRDLMRRIRFDIVTGSGKTAQTYLHWAGDRLYQMHVSYFRELGTWINSPGYHDGTAWYTRETIPKCVQCHMTYAEWIPGSINRFQREQIVFGVTCERCHGPGRQHVDFHSRNPAVEESRFIANPAKLSPERSNDVCSQCHLGTATPLQAPFSFRPGDKLTDHFQLHPEQDAQQGVVHTANQLERMQKSACYLGSDSLTCASCHNPHRNEHGNLKLFSSRCMTCHQPEHCGMSDELGLGLTENCIDCHMGMGYDDHIRLETPDEVHMPLLRDHFIRVLPEASQQFLDRTTKQ